MKYTKWNLARGTPTGQALLRAGITPLAAAVLCARGIDTPEKAARFLAADMDLLHDPFLLAGMDRAVERIRLALAQGEHIAVYGDYDVDGITSATLLTSYLRSLGAKALFYIPNRIEEGYGLNENAIAQLARQGVSLIITVDCGITNLAEVDYANRLGIDIIITDHHECKGAPQSLPQAAAVVNPRREDCPYPFKALAGVGVALKLALALTPPEKRPAVLLEYADLAAIGTVADVMLLTGENRALVSLGLERLPRTARPGLRALLHEAGMDGKVISSTSIGFALAPRINAAGRMGCAGTAVELLLTQDPDRGEELARVLCELNRTRQAIELEIYQECLTRPECNLRLSPHAIVLTGEGWHQGVVGIVASRLAEQFARPVFMICLNGDKGKGSCRSYGGLNLFSALAENADLLESFGGHALAAGFTIRRENIPAFRHQMNEYAARINDGCQPVTSLDVDVEISDPALLSPQNVMGLCQLEPYGNGNPRPVFAICGATIISIAGVGGGKHTRLRVSLQGKELDAIFFSVSPQDTGLSGGDRVDLAFYPQINEFRGSRSVQLLISDLRPALTQMQTEQLLYERYRAGMDLSPQEAAALTPTREEFVQLWRYLARYAASGCLEETPVKFSRKLARTFHRREAYTRTMVCLEVLDERGLITMRTCTDHLQISLNQVEGKVDLEASHILRRLRDLSQTD